MMAVDNPSTGLAPTMPPSRERSILRGWRSQVAAVARNELTVEAIDPLWSQALGPYGPWQVQPSGTTPPIVVTVSRGGNLQQDILMPSSAVHAPDWFETADFTSPAPPSPPGQWLAGLRRCRH